MVFDFLFGQPKREEYRLISGSKVLRLENPLPSMVPSLYLEKPADNFAAMNGLLDEMERDVGDTIHLLHLPRERMEKMITYNISNIMRITPVYTTFLSLKKRDMGRYIINCHRLSTLVHACACFGSSDMVPKLKEELMPVLLGIFTRYYGVPYMKDDELTTVNQTRKFDISAPKEREMRDDFLSTYRKEMARLAELSEDRLRLIMGDPDSDDERIEIILHILLYTNRLMGRTALDMNLEAEKGIHELAAYVGELYTICAAQKATNKRMEILIAESYTRFRSHRKIAGLEKSARHNAYALYDLMDACRIHLLEFFQGGDGYAFYSEPDRIFVCGKPQDDGFIQWQCYRQERATPFSIHERKKRGRKASQYSRIDPKESELIEVPNERE